MADIIDRLSAVDRAIAGMNARADAIVQRQIERIAAGYVRERDLPRLLARIDPEIPKAPPEAVILALELAYRTEQRAAASNHWSRAGMSAWRAMNFRAAILAERRTMQRVAA